MVPPVLPFGFQWEGKRFILKADHKMLRWNLILKAFTKIIVHRRGRITKFHFEIMHRLELYHRASEEMSRQSKFDNNSAHKETHFDGDTPAYFVSEQKPSIYSAADSNHSTALIVTTHKAVFGSQLTSTYCKR